MAYYRNTTQGARAIHLTNGTTKLVEPGATASVAEDKVARLAPGLVECDDPSSEVPELPEDLAERFDHDGDKKPGGSKKQSGDDLPALRAEYKAKLGKAPFNGWDAATLREKIAAA
jgi:hypothetical protein